MIENSKSVVQSGNSNVRSALVKAFESWQTPFDTRPDGVFGSVAIIRSRDVTLSSKDLDVEFVVPFDDDMEANEAEITIYNLSDNTIKNIEQDAAITIEAGYEGDTGVLFEGMVSKVKTVYEGADKVTTIYALDDFKEHPIESIAFAANTNASYILRQLIEKTGIPVAAFNPRRDHVYVDSQTVDGDLMENIKKYAEVCGISVYVCQGKIYARYITEGDGVNFNVSSETGMIGSPSAYTEDIKAADFVETVNGYEVSMLLQHRMRTGAIVELESKAAVGTYRVCKGVHRFSPDEAITEIKMY